MTLSVGTCVYVAQRSATYFNAVSHGVNYSQASIIHIIVIIIHLICQ